MLSQLAALLLTLAPTGDAPAYDTRADARRELEHALACARSEERPLLLIFGANWCGWCQEFHHLLARDREAAELIDARYETLSVDVGRFDKNLDLAEAFGVHGLEDTGIPILVLLRPDGSVRKVQDPDAFVVGDGYSRRKVLQFLRDYAVNP